MEKRPYRVLLVDLAKTFGGAEIRVLTQARALQDLCAGCDVVTLNGSMLHARLQHEGLPHQVVHNQRGNPATALELQQIMTKKGYHVVDAHNVQSILWGIPAAKLADVPNRIATIHSDFVAEYPGMKGRVYGGVLKGTRTMLTHTINVTEVLQEQAVARGQGNSSTLIPNAVPVPDSPTLTKQVTRADEWGFSADDFIVAIIGRLVAVKGHRYLLEAMAQLEDVPHVKLLIVGTGTLEQELKEQATQLGLGNRVHFAGFRQDILDILENVDMLCMASLSEALPYVILEAASRARAVVATRVGGLATLLEHEQTGLLVPAENPTALAEALRRLATHPTLRHDLALNLYTMVKERFSLERMMTQILSVYDLYT
ncbi:MAG: glycosyltransferase [Phototrophicaceae bacterium]